MMWLILWSSQLALIDLETKLFFFINLETSLKVLIFQLRILFVYFSSKANSFFTL